MESACVELYHKGCVKWRTDSHEFSGTFDDPETNGAYEDENGVEKMKVITICRFRRINGILLYHAFVQNYDRPISTL